MYGTRTRRAALALATAAGAFAFATPALAADATFTVTSTADTGAGTLRAALQQIDESADGTGTKTVLLTAPGPYSVSQSLRVNEERTVVIKPSDPDAVAKVVGNKTDSVFDVRNGADVAFERLDISGGQAADTVADEDWVDGTTEEDTDDGGGIHAFGATVRVTNGIVRGNTAPGTGGEGGGISVYNGTLYVYYSTVTGNTAGESGGGIDVDNDGTGTDDSTWGLLSATISANTAPAGAAADLFADGDLANTGVDTISGSLYGSTITGNGTAAKSPVNALRLASDTDQEANVGLTIVVQTAMNLDAGASCFKAEKATKLNTDPKLQALRTTLLDANALVHPPAPGSPAIDAAPDTECSANAVDGRDASRKRDGNGDGALGCDIGAVEYDPPLRDNIKATDVSPTEETITLDVLNGDAPVTAFVQYGTTEGYGSATAPVGVSYAQLTVPVSIPLTGLAPLTTYHYRVVLSDGSGTFTSIDRTFVTPRNRATTPNNPVTPPQNPVVTPPALVATVAKLPKLQLKSAAKKGLTVKTTCTAACNITAKLTTTKKLGKRLKVKKALVSSAKGAGPAGTAKSLKLKFSKKLVKRMRKAKIRKLTLTITATPTAGGAAKTVTRTVKVG